MASVSDYERRFRHRRYDSNFLWHPYYKSAYVYSTGSANHTNNIKNLNHSAQLSLGDNYVAITPFVNLLVRGYGQ